LLKDRRIGDFLQGISGLLCSPSAGEGHHIRYCFTQLGGE
jgi:hypothetical protein